MWNAALDVRLYGGPLRVASSTSTLDQDIEAARPATADLEAYDDVDTLASALGLSDEARGTMSVNGTRSVVYRYDPDDRVAPDADLRGGRLTLPLPPVPDPIEPGRHYVVREVLFTLTAGGVNDLPWRALVEPETGTVLYLRPLAASATACVFPTDPVSATGTALTGCSPAASLDPIRTTVTLQGLDAPSAAGVQALSGEYVALQDTDLPTVVPPTTTSPFSFCYSSVTDDFTAASAYFHYDALYRIVAGMGFNVATYFEPHLVPRAGRPPGRGHAGQRVRDRQYRRQRHGQVHQRARRSGCPVGIATDPRLALHEFGHALLYDHVSSPNFGWCHSAGDTLGVVLHDAGLPGAGPLRNLPRS